MTYIPANFDAAIRLLGLYPSPNPGEKVKRIELTEGGWVVWYEGPPRGDQPTVRRERRGYAS